MSPEEKIPPGGRVLIAEFVKVDPVCPGQYLLMSETRSLKSGSWKDQSFRKPL